jgi:hypothetical protein
MRLPDPTRFLHDPWTPGFTLTTVGLASVASGVISIRDGADAPWALAFAVVGSLLGAWGFQRLRRPESGSSGLIALVIGFGVAIAGAFAGSGKPDVLTLELLALPFALAWPTARMKVTPTARTYVLIPILFGLVCLGTAAILGQLAAGGFPAVLAIFLSLVLHATRRIEQELTVPSSTDDHPEVHRIHRGTLARISVVFFLFGVVCLWPWLGKMYGNGYFWIMALGVLVPIMLYWGRLRQPRSETSYEALVRFNRLAPYLAMVLGVALIVG